MLTCAAIGAIHYGWKALPDSERDALLRTVSAAFEVGTELVRAVVAFAVDTIRSLIAVSSTCLKELKNDVARAAGTFGRHLSDITGSVSDRFRERMQLAQAGMQVAVTMARAYMPDVRGGKHPANPADDRTG